MKNIAKLLLLLTVCAATVQAAVLPDILSGFVKGSTVPNHNYTVLDSLIINPGDTLQIAAGDTIIMQSPTGWIHVLGTFICDGTQANPNVITAPADRRTGPGQWGGIVGDSCKLCEILWTTIVWAGGNNTEGHAYRTIDVYSDYQNTTSTIFTDNTVIGTVDDCIGLHGGNASILRNTIKWCGAPDGDNINVKSGTVGEIAYNVIWGSGGNGIKINADVNLLRLTDMCVHNNTILAGGWRRIGELGYAILVDKSARAEIYNNIMGDMYQDLEITIQADTLAVMYDNNLFFYSADSLKGQVRYYPTDGVGRPASHDIFDVASSDLFVSYQPYFTNDYFALDGANNYHVKPSSEAVGHGFTPPASWYNPFFGSNNLPGDANIGAMGAGSIAAVKLTEIASSFALRQNYPNPFNPTTTIDYVLPREAPTSLQVFNVLGQSVRTLVSGVQAAGKHSVRFDATNLPSGVYLYRLQSGSLSNVGRMMLLK